MPDREILFRGKRLDNGKWTYGYLFCIWERAYILWGTTNDIPDMIEIDPSTVCRYTGLTDKHGTRIFEGDLLSYNCGDGDSEVREVRFLNGRFIVQWVVSGDIDDRPYQTIKMAMVIGNIFDERKNDDCS